MKNYWGTNWNTLSFSKKYDDRLFLNADYTGWTMHKKASVLCAVVLSLDGMFTGWVELGGKIESLSGINSVDLEIISSLGALYTG